MGLDGVCPKLFYLRDCDKRQRIRRSVGASKGRGAASTSAVEGERHLRVPLTDNIGLYHYYGPRP